MEKFASLAVIEAAVRRELDAQERRADAADTRAGLVLGFAGVIASVGLGDVWPPLAVAGRLVAGVAALVSLSALAPPIGWELDAEQLRRRYLAADPTRTRIALLDTEAAVTAFLAHRLRNKLARLRLAAAFLMVAVALTTTGVTVEVTR